MAAYYNEIDPKAAAWLRELIRCGHIAAGEVDERSILEVRPDDLRGFTQCHFFAGIGVWSYALRCAGWPDDRPVWTGSCPCQPFSAAGKGGGFDDERHLWPAFHHLIAQRRPRVLFGEQVASKDGLAWLDLVQADLEGENYAFGAFDLCAAGFGAPHIRQRLYWVAESDNAEWRTDGTRGHDPRGPDARRSQGSGDTEGRGAVGRVADSDGPRCRAGRSGETRDGGGEARLEPSGLRDARPLDHAADPRRQGAGEHGSGSPLLAPRSVEPSIPCVALGDAERARLEVEQCDPGISRAACGTAAGQTVERASPGACNGHWSDADWLYCRDGKYRPVEPGTFPLAHGAPARVVRLRGYGNAINAEQARCFIEAYRELK